MKVTMAKMKRTHRLALSALDLSPLSILSLKQSIPRRLCEVLERVARPARPRLVSHNQENKIMQEI
jgi:hypothetical protein